MSYVITALLGALAGFIAARFIRVKGFHKDVAQVLLECMELEEKQAAALGKKSMIDYVVGAYGMDYAVVHYGSIFHILRGMPKKMTRRYRSQGNGKSLLFGQAQRSY